MFAGPRVISTTMGNNDLPEGFQEGKQFSMNNGFGDYLIENRKDTRQTLITLLSILLKKDKKVIIKDSEELSNEIKDKNISKESIAS